MKSGHQCDWSVGQDHLQSGDGWNTGGPAALLVLLDTST